MFKKNLHLCFFKIKCLPTSFSPPLTLDDEEDEVLNQHNQPNIIINNTNHPSVMMKNFNLVYDLSLSTTTATTSDFFSSSSSLATTADSSTDASATHPPDFSTTFASHRFFVSSPGRSNSILDSSSASTFSSPGATEKKLVGGGVPVKKYSPDPYRDFGNSMLEMIEARERESDDRLGKNDGMSDLEYLHELLLCYLTLNPKKTHKYIIGAFADILWAVVRQP